MSEHSPESAQFHCEVCGSNTHDTIAHDPAPVPVSAAPSWPETALTVGGDHRLRDVSRESHPTPCPDCGRTYLNGENVTVTAPTLPTGTRVVWSGCCDCWERRTRPEGEASDDRP